MDTLISDILFVSFHNIQKMNLVPFFVCTDRFVQGNFSGKFFSAAKHHQQFIINTAGSVGSKSAAFCHIIGGHGFDQTNRSYGNQIIQIFINPLVFFYNMCNQSQITFDQHISGSLITLSAFTKIESFFLRGEGFQKGLHIHTSKGFLSNLCPGGRICAFPKM